MSYHEAIESTDDPLFCVCGLAMEDHEHLSADWVDAEPVSGAEDSPAMEESSLPIADRVWL